MQSFHFDLLFSLFSRKKNTENRMYPIRETLQWVKKRNSISYIYRIYTLSGLYNICINSYFIFTIRLFERKLIHFSVNVKR